MENRRSTIAPRNLTLTEELEKLEQSITLTLQEIDHNFSRAHRIVTTSILPIVEQYAKHSEAVWDGSKFWKQFFEASANVSLSGYEEMQHEDTTVHDEDETVQGVETDQPDVSSSQLDESITSPERPATHQFDDDLLSSPSMGGGRHSTPRMPTTATKNISNNVPRQPAFDENYSSPYESLKQQVDGGKANGKAAATLGAPATPGRNPALPDMSMTPDTSPFNPNMAPPASIMGNKAGNKDTYLHQGILNKNFRVQATPHTARKTAAASKFGATPGTANRTRRILDFEDIMSSPLEEAPDLRLRGIYSPMKGGARTPGKSVLTPNVKKQFEERRTRDSEVTAAGPTPEVTRGRTGGNLTSRSIMWDSDDEDDDDLGMSPPKTIMFNLPESRVMQTPAQEASRRIVEDIMYSAGGDMTEEIESSPSIIGRNRDPLDDTF